MRPFVRDCIIDRLRGGYLVAIADVHTDPVPRQVVDELLRTGEVKILFMEWPSRAKVRSGGPAAVAVGGKHGVYLQDAALSMRADGLTYPRALDALQRGGYFDGLRLADALPALDDLAARAIANNVIVAPCDTKTKAVKKVLKAAGHVGVSGEVADSMLILDPGLQVRDEETANNARRAADRHGIRDGLLMLWGANHFAGNPDRTGLADLMRRQKFNLIGVFDSKVLG